MTCRLAGSNFGVGMVSGWGDPVYHRPYGAYGDCGRPLGWGLGGWGLGSVVYSSGYAPYYNPYYVAASDPTSVCNYAVPIPIAAQRDPVLPPGGALIPVDTDAITPAPPADLVTPANFDAARELFRQGDFPAALSRLDVAIGQTRTDEVVHEFLSASCDCRWMTPSRFCISCSKDRRCAQRHD